MVSYIVLLLIHTQEHKSAKRHFIIFKYDKVIDFFE